MRFNKSTNRSLSPLAGVILTGCLFTGSAAADIMFNNPPDSGVSTAFYQNYAWAAALNSNGGFTSDMGEGTLYSSTAAFSPLNLSTSFSENGANITAQASTIPGGFFSARNAASLNVSNTADENGYYAIGASGSRTTVEFFSAQALADRALFRWLVTGIESPNNPTLCIPDSGVFETCATSRIDFLATTNTNLTFNDLFDPGQGALKEFGPGLYTYSIGGMPLDQVISLMYWTSAFVQINASQTVDGGSFSAFSNYSNTYELVGIDLFDINDVLITEWTMTDKATGDTVFDQDGKVVNEEVPEPTSLALWGLALAALGYRRRRRA